MFPHREYARERVAQAAARLAARVWHERAPLSPALSGPVARGEPAGEYRPVGLGEPLGPLFATHWLRATGAVPREWAGARVDLLLETGGEATLWACGEPVQGLSTGARQARPDATVVASAAGGERLTLDLELASNDPFGLGESGQGLEQEFVLRRCELARFDREAWDTWCDVAFLAALESSPGLDGAWAGELLAELYAFTLDGDRERLWRLLARGSGSVHELSAVGHAHLDTAWLWPLEETWRKLVRTTATQLRLLDEYPEHVFAHSQAQHYDWLRERAPAMFARVREAVEAGRWIPVGGTWIEPDCNLPSGESLARQFLYGQRFFEQAFGRRCTEFWNPDVFGYTAQLPQLMREAGITRFLTQKLSWNRFTSPESHTFTWQGLDGSSVLTHFPPADTYNAEATVEELRRSAAAYKDHGRSHHGLLVFGHGDGGGGPTREMLERLRRAGDVAGLPRTVVRSPAAFFDDLEADARDLRIIVGELYLEFHRGTYTSQAAIKRGNRRGEGALHDAELLSALRAAPYPREELGRLWRVLLLNQFHDILPGSSITEVNERARRDLAEVEAGAEALCRAALPPGETPVNTRGWPRREVVLAPDGELALVSLPPCGAGAVLARGSAASPAAAPLTDRVAAERLADGSLVLANEHLRAVVAPDGTVVSLVAAGREALSAPANRLEIYDDEPTRWDAWELDPVHLETRRDLEPAAGVAEVREHPLRAEVAFERGFIRQTIRLDAASRRLEIHTEVDWLEEHKALKVAFPLAVHATEATYEVAFGAVRRPTHASTQADLARFEVPGHRWADLSEHGFGVAVLTDAKYGYSAFGDTLRITLLRAPRLPDPEADRGRHAFAYALLPHAGGWQDGGVVAEAAALNSPVRWSDAAPGSWASVDGGLVLDTVKRAEDSDALVLRLYEPHGGRGEARVRLAAPLTAAVRANLLEDEGAPLELRDGEIVVPFRPWEIVTVIAR
ncbi:alpha-mannosidase [Candidatus Solirubrobacter pratensis]|uniref:alpha-mannosidase n=1 Tax=Candidatus Solirubrobacter pratensis TaxID=1298857 RepID=UPI0004861209|nr:glycoside hydrolase family 38 C-terminal domain-containing protein [Candidatus Solirubrobacter pratensis]